MLPIRMVSAKSENELNFRSVMESFQLNEQFEGDLLSDDLDMYDSDDLDSEIDEEVLNDSIKTAGNHIGEIAKFDKLKSKNYDILWTFNQDSVNKALDVKETDQLKLVIDDEGYVNFIQNNESSLAIIDPDDRGIEFNNETVSFRNLKIGSHYVLEFTRIVSRKFIG